MCKSGGNSVNIDSSLPLYDFDILQQNTQIYSSIPRVSS